MSENSREKESEGERWGGERERGRREKGDVEGEAE